MKRVMSQLLMICLALGLESKSWAAQESGTAQSGEVIARLHWAGLGRLGAATNGRTFKEIWSLPLTAQLREETLDKLAASFATAFTQKDNGHTDSTRLIRPGLTDLCESEWIFEAIEHPENVLESTLAVRLDDARMRVWQTNWSQLLTSWRLRPGLQTERISVMATNSWFTVRALSGKPGHRELQTSSILKNIQQKQRPMAAPQEPWFNLEANLARISYWLARPGGKDLPRLNFSVTGRKEYLRSEGRLTFAEPLMTPIEKWAIPTNTIRDPLISFTALQGFRGWLQRQPLIQELGLDQAPNQLFLWGLSQTAFQVQAAVPVSDASAGFNRIAEKWIPRFNSFLAEQAVGHIIRLPDRPELVWRDLPLLVPHLNIVREGNQDYLHAGIFPVDPPTNAAPPQLFQQLTSQSNLLYYDWEITEARLAQLRPLLQLSAVFLTVSPISTNSIVSKWLDVVEPRLGNSVTEISRSSPRDLQIVRTSHLGLNGLELLSLAKWLESTNFPKLKLDVQFRPIIRSITPNKAP